MTIFMDSLIAHMRRMLIKAIGCLTDVIGFICWTCSRTCYSCLNDDGSMGFAVPCHLETDVGSLGSVDLGRWESDVDCALGFRRVRLSFSHPRLIASRSAGPVGSGCVARRFPPPFDLALPWTRSMGTTVPLNPYYSYLPCLYPQRVIFRVCQFYLNTGNKIFV